MLVYQRVWIFMDCQPLDDGDADVICLSIAYVQNNNGWHRADGRWYERYKQ